MRILTKLFFLSVTGVWLLHYYCQVIQCPTELQTVCLYTSPSVWEKTLLENNEFYRNQLSPKVKVLKSHYADLHAQYQKKIIPKVIDWANYFYFEVVSPKIDAACQFMEEFDIEPYREWSLVQIHWVRQQIRIRYNVDVKPLLVQLDDLFSLSEKYRKIHRKVAPVVGEFGGKAVKYLEFACREAAVRIGPHCEKIIGIVNVHLRPISKKLWRRCRHNESCFKTSAQLRILWHKVKISYVYLTAYIQEALAPYADDVKSSIRAKKLRSKSNTKPKSTKTAKGRKRGASIGGDRRAVSQTDTRAGSDTVSARASKKHSTVSTSDAQTSATATNNDDYNEDDETPYTITSTIMVTVTGDADQNEIASLPQNTTNAELEVSEQDAVKDEFEAWFRVIDQKSSGIVKTFDKEVDKYLHRRVQSLDDLFKNKTRNISESLQKHYRLLNRAIQDINCTCETDPNSDNVTCFDSSGTTQLPEYITRARMREFFAEAHDTLNQSMLQLKRDLEPIPGEVDQRIDLIREEMVEVYEEWGDAMVSEWSKRLAYIDVLAGHLDNSDTTVDEESSENWRNFLSLKKKVIGARDELAEHPANLHEIKQFVKKVQYLVQILTQEAGEYLYILRARANLAFQAREKETNKREDSPRMDFGSGQKSDDANRSTTASTKKKSKKIKKTKKVTQDNENISDNLHAVPESSNAQQSNETSPN